MARRSALLFLLASLVPSVCLGAGLAVRGSAPEPATEVNEKTCLVSRDKTVPSQEPKLEFCTEYTASACCSPREDAAIKEDVQQTWQSILGHCPGCLENMRRLLCSIKCAPDVSKKMLVQKRDASGVAIASQYRMCPQFCHSWFQSCTNTSLHSQFHNNENPFCESVMDSNENITVSLTSYNCFNSEGPNMCDGSIKEASPHKRANTIYFIATCIVLGSIALFLTGAIIFTSLRSSTGRKAPDGPDNDSAGAPLLRGDGLNAPHGDGSLNM